MNELVTSRALVARSTVRSSDQITRPTIEAYADFDFAYGALNSLVLNNELRNCLVTMARKPGMRGVVRAESFVHLDGNRANEICINPDHLRLGEVPTLLTLIQAMLWVWAYDLGPKNPDGTPKVTRGYHSVAMAKNALSIGLHPTHDGTTDGKRTGYGIDYLIVEGGPFDVASRELLALGFRIHWRNAGKPNFAADERAGESGSENGEPSAKPTRARFTCPVCDQRAWAKYSALLVCGNCSRPMKPDSISAKGDSHV